MSKTTKTVKPVARVAKKQPSLLQRASTIAASEPSREFARGAAIGVGAAIGLFAATALHNALAN